MGSLEWNHIKSSLEDQIRKKPADDVKKKIPIPDPVPAGNKLAHLIRSIHWNSKGMLPSTAGSQRTYDKYNTVTHLSFQGPEGFELFDAEAAGGFERKKETVEDLMMSPRNQIFNRWKVPERMLGTPPASVKSVSPAELMLEPDVQVEVHSIPPTPTKVPATPLPTKQLLSPAISRMSREMSLPNIKIKSPGTRVESRNGLQLLSPGKCRTPRPEDRRMRAEPSMVPQRSKTMFVESPMRSPRVDANGVRLGSALLPEAVPQAEEWMKHADKADKRVIERILKMASKKHALENSLKKSLLPDAKDTVDKWMKDANEEERQVAYNFFSSLAGGQLMGMTIDSQRKRLKDVLNTLEDSKPGAPSFNYRPRKYNTRRRKEALSDGNLKYVRLLTPHTRENRWMHTTWHHLPEYKDDDTVGNWSSHYIRPHEQTPRHFVIHPDWG